MKRLISKVRRDQVAVGYAALCVVTFGAAVLQHYAPGSEFARNAQHAALAGAIGGLAHLVARGVKWASVQFVARLAKKVQEATVSTGTSADL
ncbi:hypothetical protein [Kitasatospora sp. NPDC090308]|uniref:hypothetical protein n=1 Tax=Kitasatospora sp. NPDC090308 TaxID=3364082 RepID=UPI003820D2C8